MSSLTISSKYNKKGNILISDQFNNRVIETTPTGEIVWQFGLGPNDFSANSPIGTNDAERVGKYTLIACTGTPAGLIPQAPDGAVDNRVLLVDVAGNIVFQYGVFGQTGPPPNGLLNVPVQTTFVPHRSEKSKSQCECKCQCQCFSDSEPCLDLKEIKKGTILITDQGNNRIIQVDFKGNIVWQYPGTNTNPNDQLSSPNSAEKLKNGNVLIADEGNNRAIEVNLNDQVVKVFTAKTTLGACAFASRLSNGNTLLTDAGNNRIVEVDPNDNIVWQYITNAEYLSIADPAPSKALRLENGNTIIANQFDNQIIEINKGNVIVARYGLPLAGGAGPIGDNVGYDTRTIQLGLYSPYGAMIIGDYTGVTKP